MMAGPLQAPTQLDLFGLRAKAAAQAMLAHHPRSSEQDPVSCSACFCRFKAIQTWVLRSTATHAALAAALYSSLSHMGMACHNPLPHGVGPAKSSSCCSAKARAA